MTIYKKDIRTMTILFVIFSLSALATWYFYKSTRLQKEVNHYRLSQDSVLSTKLLLDKEINDLTISLTECKKQNTSVDLPLPKKSNN